MSKRVRDTIAFSSPLEARDVLFCISSFLDTESLLKAACVCRAWLRSSRSELLWSQKCASSGLPRIEGELWKDSFLLGQSKWRAWKMEQVLKDVRRLAAIPLSVLEPQTDMHFSGYMMGEIQAACKVFSVSAQSTESRLVKLLPGLRIEKDTGFQPRSKGFTQSETVVLLSSEHKLLRFYTQHNEFVGPKIDFVTGLQNGHQLSKRLQELTAWFGFRGSVELIFPLWWNEFDSPPEKSDHNVAELIRELGLEGKVTINGMLSGLSEIGTTTNGREVFYESE